MNKLEQYYFEARSNKWYGYFAIFCRLALAVAWMISGLVKIKGERFAAGLSSNHPLGQYFDLVRARFPPNTLPSNELAAKPHC